MKKTALLSLAALLMVGSLAAAQPPAVDPNALTLIKRMSDTLADAKCFTFRTTSILEVPYHTGQFVTFYTANRYAVQRPNELRVIQAGDANAFDFYYDGNSVSAYAPKDQVYSTIKAPGTIEDMLPELRKQTGIHLHITPFLFDHPYDHLTRNLQSAVIVGQTQVHGVLCDHLALRSPGVNWEVWISTGENPLPYRLAATYTDKSNLPRKFIEFSHWNLHPGWIWKSLFVFHKPPQGHEIPFSIVVKDANR